jgi:hypothetical protein
MLRQAGRSRTKVSAIRTLCARPGRRLAVHPKQNIDAARCREFLRQPAGNVKGPIIVVRDRLNAHRSAKVRKCIASTNGRVTLGYFPSVKLWGDQHRPQPRRPDLSFSKRHGSHNQPSHRNFSRQPEHCSCSQRRLWKSLHPDYIHRLRWNTDQADRESVSSLARLPSVSRMIFRSWS